MIEFASGKTVSTDYFTSTNSHKFLSFRLTGMTLTDAMIIVSNQQETNRISYNGYVFLNCKLISVGNDNGVAKVGMSYETMERTGG